MGVRAHTPGKEKGDLDVSKKTEPKAPSKYVVYRDGGGKTFRAYVRTRRYAASFLTGKVSEHNVDLIFDRLDSINGTEKVREHIRYKVPHVSLAGPGEPCFMEEGESV